MNIQTKLSNYSLIPSLGILVNSEIADEFQSLYPDSQAIDEEQIIKKLRTDPTDEEIEHHIYNSRNLVLNITEQCNFRCVYCAYSGSYNSTRTHNPKKMEYSTSKKAVELFLKNIENKKRTVKINTISIGFYGGEALLEFDLIKKIVKYAKAKIAEMKQDKIYELQFRVSTNGFLLNKKEIIDFLVRNNIGIDVSLDGPKDEHDKFRVTIDKEETWETIWANLNNIYNEYPGYFSKKITFLATLHPLHDFEKIDRFFLENPMRFDIKGLLVNNVSKTLLNETLKEKWFNQKLPQISQLLKIKNSTRLDSKIKLKKISSDPKFTAMCFPGEIKFFVSCNGKIYICERVKQDIPIGDVFNGLNYDAIRKINRLWNEEIIRNRCWECPARSICHFCVSHSEDQYGVRLDCNYKENFQNVLSNYLINKEDEKINAFVWRENTEISVKEYFQQL